jgi:hypothetical protein
LPEMQMPCQEEKLKKNALKPSLPRTPGRMTARASRSLTYERMQRPGSGCTSTGATCLQSRTGLIRSMQIFTDRSKSCSSAIGLGVSQKVTKRTEPEFGVNADTSFPSFASVNLFWFAAVAASLRRGALGGTHSRHGDSRPRGASACRAAPWVQHRGTEMVKAFAPGGERLSNLPWCLTHKAVPLRRFTACS